MRNSNFRAGFGGFLGIGGGILGPSAKLSRADARGCENARKVFPSGAEGARSILFLENRTCALYASRFGFEFRW